MRKLTICLIMLLMAGCAVTQVTSYKDRSVAAKAYQKMAVLAIVTRLDGKQRMETVFTSWLGKSGLGCIAASNLIPPTRADSRDIATVRAEAKSQGYDSLLTIKLDNAYNDYASTGGSSYTHFGRRGIYSFYAPPSVVALPRATFTFELWDTHLAKVAWTSTSITAGNAYASVDVMLNSLAKEILAKMSSDGIIAVKDQ